ncbi:MAG TPA: MmgE/PrpD family protein [Dehalococcoidia bacterium]|nr:MmgE/PrpD family protein [Dehalococcoidia bacterium]
MDESLILAKHIADISYDDIPRSAVDVTKKSLLDGLGVITAAGTMGEGCRQFIDLAIAGEGKKESTIIGFDARVTASMAAFANGSMSHALDFEDAHDKALVHPNAAAIPAALAVAESIGNVSGKELITALTLGSDVTCRLGLALTEDPIQYGWYTPPILGAFGATAATCKLLNLSPEQILDAFSLTLCQATCSAELTHSHRSLVRSIRDAFSAKTGVLSAQLAERGVIGFEKPIEGEAGLFRLYARENYDLAVLTDGLGEIFEGANVSFKPWPSCRGTHYFLETTLEIVNAHDIRPADIEYIKVGIGPSPLARTLCEPLESKQHPKTAIDAKFSIPFVVALASVRREVALKHFIPEAIVDPEVLEIARKVTYEVDNNLGADEGLVELKSKQGVFRLKTPEFAYGHPSNPISEELLVRKFVDCAAHSAKQISDQHLKRLVEMILNLEDVRNIGEIMAYL